MRWTPKRISVGMLAVAAAILAVAATMDPVDTTPDEFGEIGSAVSVDPSRDIPGTDVPPVPATTPPPVITLGDLDPPPGPCTVAGWMDLPGAIHPVTHTGPNPSTGSGVQRVDTHQHGRPLCIALTPAASGGTGAHTATTRLSTKDARVAVAAVLLTIANTIR